jgi:UDPglucose--hexose-1-phosphate uridylyltransferase
MNDNTSNINERRWNPLFQRWTIMALARQDRPLDVKSVLDNNPPVIMQSEEEMEAERSRCPFCVGAPEVPEPFDVKVLGNRFPALDQSYTEAVFDPGSPYKVGPAFGHQEVVLYTPDHYQKFGNLPVDHLVKLANTWKERYIAVSNMPGIEYVFQFENRGAMIGVSLKHPHGQLYGFSWIPHYVKAEIESVKAYKEETGRCLLCDIIKHDSEEGTRVIKENDNFITIAPFFAAWPHEVHVYPKKHVQSLVDFDDDMILDFAKIMKDINYRFDNLYPGYESAFVMAFHAKPTNDENYDYFHFHLDFYPPMRKAGVQKFTAGVETSMGDFINSTLPEETAEKLRAIDVPDVE